MKTIATFQQFHPQRNQIREQTRLANHVRPSQVPSVLVPGLMVDGPEVFVCPACKREHDKPNHGDLFACEGCDTLYEVYGNSLGIG